MVLAIYIEKALLKSLFEAKMATFNTKNIGNSGENISEVYLKKLGYKILERNFYIGGGELDIIALDGDTLVFVEVKTRNSFSFGSPLESITKHKIDKIIFCAKLYISSKKLHNMPVRFDVISIAGQEIEHIKDAFWLN